MTTFLDQLREHAWTTAPAVRRNVGTFIGIAGPTGSGKTFSALELATGLTPPGQRFAVIDTEHERALMYADDYPFDHCPFDEPFSSIRYASAIAYHIAKGYKVIVVDSASHEYMGEGGMHDEHDRVLAEMIDRAQKRGDRRPDWQLYETYQWPAWREPKRAHKQFKGYLTRLPAGCHVILCFRAEQKTEMATVKENGQERKTVRPKQGATGRDGWFPICDAALPYEMTVSFLVLADKPGLPLPIKATPSRLAPFFPLDKQLSRESGRLLAEWARGGATSGVPQVPAVRAPASPGPTTSQPALVAEVKRLARGLNLSAADGRTYRTTHCEGKDLHEATVEQLTALVADLKTRAGDAA